MKRWDRYLTPKQKAKVQVDALTEKYLIEIEEITPKIAVTVKIRYEDKFWIERRLNVPEGD